MKPLQMVKNMERNAGVVRDATKIKNARVIKSLLGPAIRGYILQRGKNTPAASIPSQYKAHFNFEYRSDFPDLKKLYQQAKRDQWDSDTALDWGTDVDPLNPEVPLLLEHLVPFFDFPEFRQLPQKERQNQIRGLVGWLLSQILHGEQGALFAACQLTEAVGWMDAKLYGSTQVIDEGRHVEVFQRYIIEKLDKLYEINDNLYVIIDSLMTDSRWDLKFLGMQIMIEGLALAAFGTMRQNTKEPLLKNLLRYVITDEARHVHFGVVALEDYYGKHLSPRDRREREDWAFEMTVLMRNRFLAHEFYDEFWGHRMSRRAWDKMILRSAFMDIFRKSLYRRIIPNLKRINLLSDRIRPHYEELGLLAFEDHKAAPDLALKDMLNEGAPS